MAMRKVRDGENSGSRDDYLPRTATRYITRTTYIRQKEFREIRDERRNASDYRHLVEEKKTRGNRGKGKTDETTITPKKKD